MICCDNERKRDGKSKVGAVAIKIPVEPGSDFLSDGKLSTSSLNLTGGDGVGLRACLGGRGGGTSLEVV